MRNTSGFGARPLAMIAFSPCTLRYDGFQTMVSTPLRSPPSLENWNVRTAYCSRKRSSSVEL